MFKNEKELIEAVQNESVLPELREAQGVPWHLAAEADEAVGKAYRALVGLKMSFDRFQEIPKEYMPLYRWIMKAMGSVGDSRDGTNQVREMVKRAARRF